MNRNNKLVFCTLFDSNYLDKGLALYNSLNKVCENFILYVIAFDDLAYSLLKKMKLMNLEVINIGDVEDDVMRRIKKERSRGEYCWTCTPIIIEHVLEKYDEDICTYIDSDLFFYTSPEKLFEEMEEENASVLITPHNYYPCLESKIDEKYKGKYCVQFNTFKNDENGRQVLSWWKNKCLECCTSEVRKDVFGDQKYLDFFENFKGVCSTKSKGLLAPWNVAWWKEISLLNDLVLLKRRGEEQKLIFYHFHNINYIDNKLVDIRTFVRPGKAKEQVVLQIYMPYLQQVEEIRDMLKKEYGLDLRIKVKSEIRSEKKQDKCKPNILLRCILRIRKKYRYLLWREKDYISLS